MSPDISCDLLAMRELRGNLRALRWILRALGSHGAAFRRGPPFGGSPGSDRSSDATEGCQANKERACVGY
jgi:hypothetical protein